MIIPQPKDLPPKAGLEAGKLTASLQDTERGVKDLYTNSVLQIQQNNVSLQALAEQVDVISQYIGTLPADVRVYAVQTTAFNLTTGTYTTMASLNVPMLGYSNVTMWVVCDGVIVDTTIPYFTVSNMRIVVDGVPMQEIHSNYAYYGSPPRDFFHVAKAYSRNDNTTDIVVQVQANPDQDVTGNADSFARIGVFCIYT